MKAVVFFIVMLILCSCINSTPKIEIKFNSKLFDKRIVEIANIEEDKNINFSDPFKVMQKGKEVAWQRMVNPVSGKASLLIYPEVKTGKIEIIPGNPSVLEPLTHAELWHKNGGKFINKKYIGGGDFVEVNSMLVPDSCTDHSFYIKYEGPGWESNLVGYRFYLDWRNAIDVYGKKTTDMILEGVGQDGYDSYHEMQPWGMDILKVGSTLGVGTIAYWNGEAAERVAKTDSVCCEIMSKGGLRSEIKTSYYGWQTNDFKTNFQSYLTIDANSRLTKEVLIFDKAPANVCTGIYIDKNADKIELTLEDWTCIATWGVQSLNNDNLGLCIFAKNADILQNTADKLNYVLVMEPESNIASWLFGAVWELDPSGIKTKEEFIDYLNMQLELLNHPDEVTIK
jgi:hypothetical protein